MDGPSVGGLGGLGVEKHRVMGFLRGGNGDGFCIALCDPYGGSVDSCEPNRS